MNLLGSADAGVSIRLPCGIAGRANGFGGPVAPAPPADSRETVDGDGGGKCSTPAGGPLVMGRGEITDGPAESPPVPAPDSEGSDGICNFRLGRSAGLAGEPMFMTAMRWATVCPWLLPL